MALHYYSVSFHLSISSHLRHNISYLAIRTILVINRVTNLFVLERACMVYGVWRTPYTIHGTPYTTYDPDTIYSAIAVHVFVVRLLSCQLTLSLALMFKVRYHACRM